MFEELNKLLRVDSYPLEQLNFIHIEQREESYGIANSAFLVHHFISYFIKHGFKVCLMSCSQSYSQYKIIQHKLGVNLEKCTSDGTFMFVSVLNNNKLINPQESQVDVSSHKSDICSSVLDQLDTKLEESQFLGSKTGPCLMLVDDLTALTDLGARPCDILNMLCSIRAKYGEDNFSTLLTSSCRFDSSMYPTSLCSISKQLTHWSDLTLYVDELDSGMSKDVHGQLKICQRKDVIVPIEQCYHYKATERDLKLFAVGASPAVL